MASLNRVQLIGNLGRDPEVRYLADGSAVANISVATTDRWKDKTTGEAKEATEWHRVVFFKRLAEIAGEYLKQGSQVYIEGKLKTRKWEDKDGRERYTTEIHADAMQMLGNKGERSTAEPKGDGIIPPAESAAPATKPAGSFADMEDDIPF